MSAAVACVALAMGLLPAGASAAQPSLGEIKAPGGVGFLELKSESVAVNDHNGHILVADSGNGTVYNYASLADTAPEEWTGFGGGNVAVAVEQSSGDVYVADKVGAKVVKVDEEGNPVASFGTGGALDGSTTPAGTFSPAGTGTFGIAVDQTTGDLYVIDAGHEVIDVFSSAGTYVEQFTAAPGELYGGSGAYTDGIAVNEKSGELLVSTSWDLKTYRFALANGSVVGELGPFGSGYTSVAADSESGDIYINDTANSLVQRFDSGGAHLDQITGLPGGSFGGLAVDPESGDLYVSDGSSETVKAFGPPVPTHSLSVSKSGTGFGRVVSAPAGISCGPTCSASFEEGSTITLTAEPATGSSFAGWSGACSGTGPCQITIGAGDQSASAAFSFAGIVPGDCPNEALRFESLLNPESALPFSTQLPDCRAYEMVSPPFKAGSRVGAAKIGPGGSKVIVDDVGAFAGTPSDNFGAKYLLSRTELGWTAVGISPPASLFSTVDPSFFTPSEDFGKTLWGVRFPTDPTNMKRLFVREADGTFVSVGPTTPPALATGPPSENAQGFADNFVIFAGASTDLSRIVYAASDVGPQAPPWPGDTTVPGHSSLYEFEGTGNSEPSLVGVSDGSTVVRGTVVPAGSLISNCGTELGSENEADVYNAVSADGERVFFLAKGQDSFECSAVTSAPEVNEVYARVDGNQTIAISEPTSSQCAACLTSERRDATYAGAPRGGDSVFFMTEQNLLPGAEGSNLYEYNFAGPEGEKVARVSEGSENPEVLGVARVSEDGTRVFFVATGTLTSEPNAYGAEPVSGAPNLYVSDRAPSAGSSHLHFVGTLSEEDVRDWRKNDQRPVQASPDGRYLVFESQAHLTPGDHSVAPQIFEYDAETEELIRVSVGADGYSAGQASAESNGSELLVQQYSRIGGFKPTEEFNRLAISPDGHTVIFQSRAALTRQAEPAAEGGAESAYEYRSSGPIASGNVELISDGVSRVRVAGGPAAGLAGSRGESAFFLTAAPLVPADSDLQLDLYDAREGGGFPRPAAPVGCSVAGSCLGASAPAPETSSAATSTFVGPPNQQPHRKRKRGHKRHKRHHKHRTAKRGERSPK